ncbi:MAG: orotate phosphoribosyltransferase [Actinobacteria bacterium]|nr:orotate phosphoribosyltransferase [Actinomycetota bacterium]
MTSESRRTRLDRDELAERLADLCILEGEFTLRSGGTSLLYFDKYRFEADPILLASVARYLAPMVPDDIEVLAGLELGGVPIATALSLATALPAAFVRKVAKTYGTAQLAEGHDVDGRHVLVVEDVVSSGGQIILSTHDLRERGAIVEHALCAVDRGGAGRLAAESIKLHALFTMAELEAAHQRHEETPTTPTARMPDETPAPTGQATPVVAPLLPKREARSRADRKVAPKLLPRRADDP